MKYNLIVTDGGMGDLICELVAVDYIIKNNRKIKFLVWVPDYLHKFALHVLPSQSQVFSFSVAPKKFDGKLQGRTTQWIENSHTPMRTHPVDYGFHMLADMHMYDLNEKNYLQIRPNTINIKTFNLPNKYVCIAATATEACKSMSAELLSGIADFAESKGYTPVYLGKYESKTGFKDFKIQASAPTVPNHGINLINKTNMLQAATIISKAECFIGMDGGLVHLAGCTDVPIIAGYSLVDPIHVAPIRKGSQSYKFQAVEPDLDVPNRYFQTKNLFHNGDMRQFPGYEKVLLSLTLEKFISKLSNLTYNV